MSTRRRAAEGDGEREELWRIVGSDTVVLAGMDLLPVEMAMFLQCGGGLRLQPLFTPEVAWDARAGMVAVSASTEAIVDVFRGDRLVMSVRRDMPSRPATRDLAIEHMGEGMRIRFGQGDPCLIPPEEIVEKRGYAEVVPAIQTVHVAPTGELWVERFAIGQDAVGPIDVFANDGEYLGTLTAGTVTPVILLPGDRVGVMEKDEFDVERLVVLAIER